MARSRYDLLKESIQTNDEGITYPDIMSFPINKYKPRFASREYGVTEPDIDRFYIVCYKTYGVSFYDDLVLWLNNIDTVHNIKPGDTIFLPDKRDLDRFYIQYLKER